MKAWFSHHGRSLADALRRLLREPIASTFNVGVVGIALALPVGLYVALLNVQALAGQVAPEPQISLFMALDASRGEIEKIDARLRQHPGISQVRLVGRDEALKDLKRSTGLADVVDSLSHNPLPDAFVVRARDSAAAAMETLRDDLKQWPKVVHVQFDSAWARRLESALRIGQRAATALAALLGFGLVAVTFNTIRLQILSRRAEIEVSSLIGATRSFIRRPFLYFGAAQGLAGGVAAWLIIAGAIRLLNEELSDLVRLYSGEFRLLGLAGPDGLSLLVFSGVLGWLGAWLSVGRHLQRAAQ